MNSLLSRIDIACTLDDLFSHILNEYQLGSFQSYSILSDGYQELNILLVTSHGRFIVKIFSKEKTLQRVQDNVWGYLSFKEKGVPMPVLKQTSNRKYIFSIKGKRRTTHLCVMDYFDGSYLQPKEASDDDIRSLARYMGNIHTHTKRIHRYYDTMGIVNIVSQYNKFKRYLTSELLTLIQPVVKDFLEINLNNFCHSIIHGSFEPKNILKNKNGSLCLLDLGCMDYNASIIDIATFLANYTIDQSQKEKRRLADIFLHAYQTTHPLTKQERMGLIALVRTQYAVYLIRTNYYLVKLKDTTEQTHHWFEIGKRGLQQCVSLDAL